VVPIVTAELACPGCRQVTDGGVELQTLSPAGDFLACACGRRYPVVDDVPIVLADASGLLRGSIAGVIERDLSPELAAALAAPGPDDSPYAHLLEHLSVYLDSHWGDRADPPPDGGVGPRDLVDRIAARARERVGLAVELGCSTGRFVAELARGADHVVGLDLQHAALRRARHLLAGEPVAYARRMIGRHYTPAVARAGELAPGAGRTTIVCADALDPPLVPGVFDRVVALNLFDSVSDPMQLLHVLTGLCAVGGEVILSSPFAWQSHVVAEGRRLGGLDPETDLARVLGDGSLGARFAIEETAEIPWVLRRDSRSSLTYRIHYVRARKSALTS
jgi:SAM-dependent methyltransferase/uncharacterized protein YbaR (Trm112 family)